MKNSFILFSLFLILVSCINPVPRKPVARKTSSFMKESVSFNKSLNAAEEKDFLLLIKNDSVSNYITSPNGFWYKYNLKGNKVYYPKFGDKVLYTYEVYDINGNIIYDFNEIGEKSYVIDQQEIIEGLRNGLKLMNEGEVVTFLFPSHKVYGYLGDNNKININQPLIYKVQLNQINKKNESN
ncbi:gliding motility-associated peptidyl-prolyl isomerase GldI [Lutibacter sp. B1]|uniref:gliding motility-associated peptidyl-prolyl isomerase GldI n=1 Tax=Lutibacter sp. B1 TaxID=2725996 RepID=UPI001456D2C1|nr:gliding motility-associated peptidyl-prolyl isomerase GldI [Lutibacter sp. B1]NLP58396.1 gliding motility-associated peptidyl-prolyl isomerase GldI [Lutibacter sp. B1]